MYLYVSWGEEREGESMCAREKEKPTLTFLVTWRICTHVVIFVTATVVFHYVIIFTFPFFYHHHRVHLEQGFVELIYHPVLDHLAVYQSRPVYVMCSVHAQNQYDVHNRSLVVVCIEMALKSMFEVIAVKCVSEKVLLCLLSM